MTAVLKDKRAFTMAELLVVVAIIAVLVAIAIPVFSSQLEKSREATDAANIRSAYAEVRTACITDDRTSEAGWKESGPYWEKKVFLKQAVDKWDSEQFKTALDGLCTEGRQRGIPRAKGYAFVRCDQQDSVWITFSGGYFSNDTTSESLNINKILEAIGRDYKHSVIDSEEVDPTMGTAKFNAFLESIGFSMEDHGAASWTVYLKDSNGFMDKPAIYFSPDVDDLSALSPGERIPVIGFRDDHYDVYITTVKVYNQGGDDQYTGFARLGNSQFDENDPHQATFQYSTWEEALAAYNCVKSNYQTESGSADDILDRHGFKV